MSYEDLTGMKFGYWTALEYVGSKNGQAMWSCQCKCGTTKIIRAGSLKSGNSKSCGCQRRKIAIDNGFIQKGTKKIPNLVGNKYGKLTVLSMMPHKIGEHVFWKCKCECGNERIVRATNLYSGKISQCIECGKPFSYRQNYPRLCRIWSGMKDRCYNLLNGRNPDYGGRGITVCEEWRNSVEAFVEWALENGYKEGLTLDRIDNDKGYSPDNCRWADAFTQANNTRKNIRVTHNGETHTLSEWSKITGLKRTTLEYRYNHWDEKDLFKEPQKCEVKMQGG